MGNTTTFLDPIKVQTLENAVIKVQRTVDFSKENVASGSTLDIFTIPAKSVILNAGIYVNTGEASVTATLGQDGDSGNDNLLAAVTCTTTGTMGTTAYDLASVPLAIAAEDILRSAIGGANATSCVLTYWVIYATLA